MSKSIEEVEFHSALLDRLTDEAPERKQDPPRPQGKASLAAFVASVTRDLEYLLNTRRPLAELSGMPDLRSSVVGYGLEDPSGAMMASDSGRKQICRGIESTIKHFETRLHNVRVTPLANADELDRTLRFRVEGVIRSADLRGPVVFDSRIEPGRCAVRVKHVD